MTRYLPFLLLLCGYAVAQDHPEYKVRMSQKEVGAYLASDTRHYAGANSFSKQEEFGWKLIDWHFPKKLVKADCHFDEYAHSHRTEGYQGKIEVPFIIYYWGYPSCIVWA